MVLNRADFSLSHRLPLLTLSQPHVATKTHKPTWQGQDHSWEALRIRNLIESSLHLLASSCVAVTRWLLGRTVFSFPSRMKFRIAFTAINLGRGC